MKMQQDSDTGAIVLCALRYCMGRQTYMPSLVIEWAKRHWASLRDNDKALILRDVSRAVEECEDEHQSLGAAMDVVTWQNFLEWLQIEMKVKP